MWALLANLSLCFALNSKDLPPPRFPFWMEIPISRESRDVGLACAPDRNEMALSAESGDLEIWNLDTRRRLKTVGAYTIQGVVLPVSIYYPKDHFTVAHDRSGFAVYDTQADKTRFSVQSDIYKKGSAKFFSPQLSSDGRTLAIVAVKDDSSNFIQFYDTKTGKRLSEVQAPGTRAQNFHRLVISPADSNLLLFSDPHCGERLPTDVCSLVVMGSLTARLFGFAR